MNQKVKQTTELSARNSGLGQMIGQFAGRSWRYFTEPYQFRKGVESWKCWRFWIIFACYAASFLLIVHDPMLLEQNHFNIRSIFPLILAYILGATLHWEFLFTGSPHGANLLLQCVMFPSCAFLFMRCLISPSTSTITNSFWGTAWRSLVSPVTALAKLLLDKTPPVLREIFTHPWLCLLLLGCLLLLSLRNRALKISALLFSGVISVCGMLTLPGDKSYFITAVILLLMGLYLQWNPCRKLLYFKNIVERLELLPKEDERVYEVVMATMRELYDDNVLDGKQLAKIVSRIYAQGQNFTEAELKMISGEITRRMVEDFKLVKITMSGLDITLEPVQRLFEYNAVLASLTVFPRMLALMGLALLWSITPFDAIPDFIPVYGVLDDVAVSALTMIGFQGTFKPFLRNHKG